MRKKIILITLALCTLSLVAMAQLNLGIRAGIGMASVHNKIGSSSTTSDPILSFHAGAAGSFAIPLPVGAIEVESGLQFTRLGGKLDIPATEVAGREIKAKTVATESRYYLELPLRLNYRMDLSALGIYAGVGPQFGIGLFGKNTIGDATSDIKFGSKDLETSRLNIALSMHLGVILMDKLRVGFYYDLGLKNNTNTKSEDFSNKDHVYGLTAAYYIF